ncbi:MAG: LPS-assembly protein LptD [Bacteroidales bacterium]|nr:LPS-assembly protein LptD [Bacteroidales bacterium]
MLQKLYLSLCFSMLFQYVLLAQNDTTNIKIDRKRAVDVENIVDTIKQASTIININDTIFENKLTSDTVNNSKNQTVSQDTVLKISPNAIEAIIDYKSVDSIHFDLKNKITTLYYKAEILYDDLELESDYVKIDMESGTIFAEGVADSAGVVHGKPKFKQGQQEFKTEKMSYNFNTKRGVIHSVITQEGEGFMHGERIKKMEDNTTYVKSGKYTTCDLDHPHFELAFNKAKVIPDNKIVTGPAYLRIEGIPTPLAVPFGYFPNKKGRANGLIIPSYGESSNRGFFLENGGFYWGINDYIDLAILGDIYTRGSWAAKARSNYYVRYKYKGNFDLSYAVNILGEKNTAEYQKSNDYMIRWSHVQDAKAHPTRRFSADVNMLSSSFSKFNPTSANDYLSNTFQSSVSYSTSFRGRYNLTANLRHSQNTLTKQVEMSLPEINFSVNKFYPFRKKTRKGSLKWYENITVSYQNNTMNRIQTVDSLLFSDNILDGMRNGMKHTIPVSSSIKVLKYFNWNNSFTYNERWYTQSIDRNWNNGELITDTIKGFAGNRDFNFSSSLTTKLYGLVQMKKSYVRAVRHVLTPNLSFRYNPDFGNPRYGFYKYYHDQNGNLRQYSVFENSLYGNAPDRKAGMLNLSISNNLEAKVRSRKDSTQDIKVVLIENLSLSTAYNFSLDSLNWIPLVINGRTTLFRNLYMTFNSVWDPFVLNEEGKRINQLEIKENKRLFRNTSHDWNFSLNLALNQDLLDKLLGFDKADAKKKDSENKTSNSSSHSGQIWNLTLNYNLFYMNRENPMTGRFDDDIVQSLGVMGELQLTPKWKINFSSGYDFKNKDFTYTAIDVYRDLHCWEMRFNWIPFGFRKSWNFSINVKASALQDLKYMMRKDFRDAYY